MDNIQSTAIAIGTGYAVREGANTIIYRVVNPIHTKLISDDYSKKEKSILKSAFTDTFNNSEIKTKGVTVTDVTPKNSKKIIQNKIDDTFNKLSQRYKQFAGKDINKDSIFGKFILNKCKKPTGVIKQIAQGTNGAYYDNSILINLDKNARAGFHEMGHASNATSKGLSKLLFLLRGYTKAYAVPLIFATSMLKSPKEQNEKETGVFN